MKTLATKINLEQSRNNCKQLEDPMGNYNINIINSINKIKNTELEFKV